MRCRPGPHQGVRAIGTDDIARCDRLLLTRGHELAVDPLQSAHVHFDMLAAIDHGRDLPAQVDVHAGMTAHRLVDGLLEFGLEHEVVRLPPRGVRRVPIEVDEHLAVGVDQVVVRQGNRLQPERLHGPDGLQDPHSLVVEVTGTGQTVGLRPAFEHRHGMPSLPEIRREHLSGRSVPDLDHIDIDVSMDQLSCEFIRLVGPGQFRRGGQTFEQPAEVGRILREAEDIVVGADDDDRRTDLGEPSRVVGVDVDDAVLRLELGLTDMGMAHAECVDDRPLLRAELIEVVRPRGQQRPPGAEEIIGQSVPAVDRHPGLQAEPADDLGALTAVEHPLIEPREHRRRDLPGEERGIASGHLVGIGHAHDLAEVHRCLDEARAWGRRSVVYASSSASSARPVRTRSSFHARLTASRIPEDRPCPMNGGMRWAESPMSRVRSRRKVEAMRDRKP